MRLACVDQLARVHLVLGIPQPLELAECVHQLLAEHFRQQRTARLAIAVLARERAAVLDHDVGRAIDELAHVQDAGLALEIEVDAHVHAALAEVAVHRTVVPVLLHECEQPAQIRAEAIGRHGRIFPAFPSVFFSWLNRDSAEGGLAHVPHLRGFLRITDAIGRCGLQRRQPRTKIFRLRVYVFAGPRAELDEHRAFAFGQQRQLVEAHAFRAERIGDRLIKALEPNRLVRENRGHMIGRDERIGKSDRDQTPKGRAGG